MGVKSLWSLVRAVFPKTITEDCKTILSAAQRAASSSRTSHSSNVHVLVDVNALLHRAAHRTEDTASGPMMLADALRQRLDATVKQPLSSRRRQLKVVSLFVAVDGPPPLSKLLMQRERRMATAKRRRTTTSASRFNSLNFTPGSTFMMTLDGILARHISSTVNRNIKLECIYSGSRVPGEGETKIVEHMHRLASQQNNKDDLFVILTGDSDAIIHLLLATPEMRTGILNPDQRVAFLPSNMKQHLAPLFSNRGSAKVSTDLHRVQQDLALLFILAAGNDLLPSLEKTSFNALWIAYQDVIDSMAETSDASILYLLDVSASKLNLEPFARVLEKAEQLCCLHVGRPVESDRLEDLDTAMPVRNYIAKVARKAESIESVPVRKRIEQPSHPKLNISENSDTEVIASKPAAVPVSVEVPELSSEQNENAALYMDIVLWTLLGSTRGLTRDYRLMYFKHYGPNVAVLRKWIFAQLAEGKQAVFWDGPKAVSLNRNALVIPPEESQVVHSSFSKHISEFTERLQSEQDQSADAAAALPYPLHTRSNEQRALIPNKKETLLSSIQSFETLFQTMSAESSSQLYQPALKFATPCRARFVDSLKGLLTEKRANMSVDACMLPVAPPSMMNTRRYGDDGVVFAGPRKQGVCFEVMDAKTGKWVWVRDLNARVSEAKNGSANLRVDGLRGSSRKLLPSGDS
ncbi:hypothetical protein HDU80_009892 [Chytriomyces hyalinus]|nr:hypothetical protein HDU80_009892 [Chytriomyces hyalinus]